MRPRAWLPWLLFLSVAIAIGRTTTYNAEDFRVYWRTARAFFEGLPVYSVEREGAMVFKYPPWILPAFLPFGLLSEGSSLVIWAVVQGVSLLYVQRWLLSKGVSPWLLASCFIAFLGLWNVHAFAGQIALPLLALGLVAERVSRPDLVLQPGPVPAAGRGPLFQLLLWAYSSKIFTLFPLLAVRPRRSDWKTLSLALILWSLLSLPALSRAPGGSPTALLAEWREAASSGATPIRGLEIDIKGREIQSFPAMLFRALDLDETDHTLVFGSCSLLALVLGAAWALASRRLGPEERWAGWLALSVTIQPLAWFNAFVMAYPLVVLAIQRAARERRPIPLAVATVSALLVAAVTEKTLGPLGRAAEIVSVKSWGVLLCALALAARSRRELLPCPVGESRPLDT